MKELVRVRMNEGGISEAGRTARFAQWEKIGLDAVKQDLLSGAYRLIGGPPQVQALAWEWVRQKEKEAAMNNGMGESERRAFRLLQAIYERTRESGSPVVVAELAPAISLTESEAHAAWRYLKDKGLIRTYSLPYTATVNAIGIDAIERARQQPDRPMSHFPSVTLNTVNIHHAENSTIQQGGAQSNLTQSTSYGRDDIERLRQLVEIFESRLGELPLDASSRRRAAAQVATIKAQLEDVPDPTIVKQAGRTLRNVTEAAIGGLIATAAQPGVWHAAQVIMSSLFGQ